MSNEENVELQGLPSSLVTLEEAIVSVATELGGEEFRDMPEVTGTEF